MTNINNGGKTPVAGIIHAVVLLLIFLFLMPLAKYIPMACLAGVLVVVSYGMSGWRSFLALMKNPKSDVTVLLITFFLTIIFDLTIAIEVVGDRLYPVYATCDGNNRDICHQR